MNRLPRQRNRDEGAGEGQRHDQVLPRRRYGDCDSLTTCYTPQQIRVAYGIQPLADHGIDGRGQTVVHAIAPGAAIRVIPGRGHSGGLITALTDTVRMGTAHGDVISISAGGGEHCFSSAATARLHAALRASARHHGTVVASSGDTGPPARRAPSPSGGGFSHRFPRPGYQDGVPGMAAGRGVPDVSADASGHTGTALAISEGNGQTLIRNSGGTSASAPFWAVLIALANQYAGHDLGFVNPALYRIGRSPWYHTAFHDVTTGNNTVKFPPRTFTGYRARPDRDPVTGWGSPDAGLLILLLTRYARR